MHNTVRGGTEIARPPSTSAGALQRLADALDGIQEEAAKSAPLCGAGHSDIRRHNAEG
jgi:hypothetical protein